MMDLKQHRYFAILYGILYVLFLWPLIIFQKTFIYGDYWQQHYPWAFEYARCLKEGRLPYWVPAMACGFPLLAEGQVGAYYLPHLLFYGAFPFTFAYTFLILAHVLIGGVGFYRYTGKIGLSREAASICAVLYSFSSAYGGCFSNTASLKVLAWLPWAMLVPEYLNQAKGKRRFLWISLLGALLALMWTAGAPQIALYAIGYLFFYWMLKFRLKGSWDLIMANIIGIALSSPQWIATLELIPVSVRAGENTSFALWGSVMPPTLVSLIYPGWGIFLGFSFYIGAVTIFLVAICFLSKMNHLEKVHTVLLVFFLALALGKYNPVYAFFIRNLSFTALRNPSKFIFFVAVSLAVLAGIGFDKLICIKSSGFPNRCNRLIIVFLVFVLAAPAMAQFAMHQFEAPIRAFGNKQAVQAFEGKKEPPRSRAHYLEEVGRIYQRIQPVIKYSEPWNIVAIVFFVISGFALWMVMKRNTPDYWRRTVLPGILLLDLFVFGNFLGTGFTGSGIPGFGTPGNVRSVPEQLHASLLDTIRGQQAADGSAFVEVSDNELLPPNASMVYSLNQAGGYSPLLIKRYYDLAKDLGIADSSLGRKPYSEEVWKTERGVLEALGVGQIISSEKLGLPDMGLEDMTRQIRFDHGKKTVDARYVYGLPRVLPRVYAVYAWKEIPQESERLAYLKSAEFKPFEEAVADQAPRDFKPSAEYVLSPAEVVSSSDLVMDTNVNALSDAVIVFRSAFYPRWKVEIDGKLQPLIAVNHAFSGVFASKGKHHVRFYYDNKLQRAAETAAFACWMLLLTGNVILWKKKR